MLTIIIPKGILSYIYIYDKREDAIVAAWLHPKSESKNIIENIQIKKL